MARYRSPYGLDWQTEVRWFFKDYGRRVVACLVALMLLAGAGWGFSLIPWSAVGNGIDRATYAAPPELTRVSDARTRGLLELDDLRNLRDAQYLPVLNVSGSALMPAVADKSEGEATLWYYCPPPSVIDNCTRRNFNATHPAIMVSATYDSVTDRYTRARPSVVWMPGDKKHMRLSCSIDNEYNGKPLSLIVGDAARAYKLLGSQLRADGYVHRLYLNGKTGYWRCGGTSVKRN